MSPPRTRSPRRLNACPVCTSAARHSVDTAILKGIQAGADNTAILSDLVARVIPDSEDARLTLNLNQLLFHTQSCGLFGESDQNGQQVLLPNGSLILTSNLEAVLQVVISEGLKNILNGTTVVKPKDLHDAVKLLKDINGAGSTIEDLMQLLKAKITQGPPDDIDTHANPYAAPPPVLRARSGE